MLPLACGVVVFSSGCCCYVLVVRVFGVVGGVVFSWKVVVGGAFAHACWYVLLALVVALASGLLLLLYTK